MIMMRTHVSGSMSKTYLSRIGKSEYVEGSVRSVALQAKQIAEGIANGRGRSKHGHIKMSSVGPGIWNKTFVLRPRSAVARKDAKSILNSAAVRAGARMKRR